MKSKLKLSNNNTKRKIASDKVREVEMNAKNSARDQKPLDISIVGETNLDLILYGLPEQMPVEREILGSDFDMTLGGSSSILAHNLAVLGTRVGFVSEVGNDAMGDIAQGYLGVSGVSLA